MRYLIALFVVALSSISYAQKGNYYLSNYTPGKEYSDNACYDMAQDDRGVIYYATRKGILQFDGRAWTLLDRKGSVYSLLVSGSGDIYWGGAGAFGLLQWDDRGFQVMRPLADSLHAVFFKSVEVKGKVHFLSEEEIHIYDSNGGKTDKISANDQTGLFTSMFELFGAVYVNTDKGMLLKVDGNAVTPSKLNFPGDVVFCTRIEDTYVLGTTENKVFACSENLKFDPVKLQDQEYIDASVIVDGAWLNRHLLALATLRGGIIFVNPIMGRTQEIINYSTGLPDNEIFALMSDRHQNVWASHDYGFTRVSPHLPLRSFSHFQGLQGNLLCVSASKQGVYVGTSLGLFKLEKQDSYDELVYFVDVEIKDQPATNTRKKSTAPKEEEKPEETSGTKKRGLFSFLKKNRSKDEPATTESTTASTSKRDREKSKAPAPKFRRERRVKRVFRSSQDVYKKVNGIDAKITHLVELNGKLIASGVAGVYEVRALDAKPILEEPVRFLFASTASDLLLASTYQEEIVSLKSSGGKWQRSNLLSNLDDDVNYIFQGPTDEVWLCGENNLFKTKFTGNVMTLDGVMPYASADAGKVVGISWDQNLLLASRDGFFTFDRKENKLMKVDTLPQPSQFFAHHGNILYHTSHGWNLTGRPAEHENLQLLNMFDNLRYITNDQPEGNLWLISGSNQMYKFFSEKITLDEEAFPLFVKSVTRSDARTGYVKNLALSEENSQVVFEIAQPDFISPESVEFRYQLTGMKDSWSEWTDKNTVDFHSMAPGDYVLRVQAKNIFGKVSDLAPYSFHVLPPYWKRPWFYAMEFTFIALLVVLSFRLNARYRIVSRILTLLTIILLIQFMQTLINSQIPIENESPVIDFIVQVFIALLILPVEGYLRNLMFKSLDASSKFYQFMGARSTTMIHEKEGEFEATEKK